MHIRTAGERPYPGCDVMSQDNSRATPVRGSARQSTPCRSSRAFFAFRRFWNLGMEQKSTSNRKIMGRHNALSSSLVRQPEEQGTRVACDCCQEWLCWEPWLHQIRALLQMVLAYCEICSRNTTRYFAVVASLHPQHHSE